jgi:hypothetical protein
LYEAEEQPEKAAKVYNDAIKNLPPDINQVNYWGMRSRVVNCPITLCKPICRDEKY